jgi:multiple sugar transport system substrate-binding protein
MNRLTRRSFLRMTAGGIGITLAACAPAVPTGQVSTTEENAGGGAATEATTLVVASFYPVDQTAGWGGLVARFEEEQPGVTVDTQVTPGDQYLPKLLTQLASGTPPDVLGVENSPFIRFVDRNVLLDLTPLFEADSDFRREDFFPKLIDRYTVNGRVYGIPYDAQPICSLFYNKDLFDEAGVAYPSNEWSWDELLEASLALTKREGDRTSQYGFWTYNSIDGLFFVYSNGGTIVDDVKNPTKVTLDNSRTIEGVKFWQNMINEHKVAPQPTFFQGAGQGASDVFATGRVAMFLSGYWEFVFDPDKFKRINVGLQIGPSGPDGTRGYATGGTAYCIGNGTNQTDLAWEFVKFFMGMPGYEAAFAEARHGVIYPPAYIPAYNSYVFADNPEPPIENITINGDAAEYANFRPHHPKWPEILSTILTPMADLIANGQREAEEALLELQPLVQKALEES